MALANGFAGVISIHSLRMEGDLTERGFSIGSLISIHSLRMEGDSNLAQISQQNLSQYCAKLLNI